MHIIISKRNMYFISIIAFIKSKLAKSEDDNHEIAIIIKFVFIFKMDTPHCIEIALSIKLAILSKLICSIDFQIG